MGCISLLSFVVQSSYHALCAQCPARELSLFVTFIFFHGIHKCFLSFSGNAWSKKIAKTKETARGDASTQTVNKRQSSRANTK